MKTDDGAMNKSINVSSLGTYHHSYYINLIVFRKE